MANFIVGDIQGCYSGLRYLLDAVQFDPRNDKLWAVGDLIARGTQSLQTLNYLYELGDAFDTVLGNHDLHFLATHAGIKQPKKSDHLQTLLDADNVDELAHWLRSKPLARLVNDDTLICHAGLYPHWSFKKAIKRSNEVSDCLKSADWQSFLKNMYGNSPDTWDKTLNDHDRHRFIVNAFTRMRFVTRDTHRLEFDTKCAPSNASEELIPWFSVPNPKMKRRQSVVFGHWATLMGATGNVQYIGLDTGYVWGNKMTAWNLETANKTQIVNKE